MGDPAISPTKITMRVLDGSGKPNGYEATVYLPLPDAEFGVQRPLRSTVNRYWLIVHVATSRLMPGMVCPDYATRKEALVDAYRLSVGVPHAAAVRYVNGKLTGDMRRMRDECIAALRTEVA